MVGTYTPPRAPEGFGDARIARKGKLLGLARTITAEAARDDGLIASYDGSSTVQYGTLEEMRARRNNRVNASCALAQQACSLCEMASDCLFQQHPERFGGERIDTGAKALAWSLWKAGDNERGRFDRAVERVESGEEDIPCEWLLRGLRAYNKHKKEEESA